MHFCACVARKDGAQTRGLPSTREVRSVTLAALRLPAGKFRPIFSSFSRRHFPPFFDLALREETVINFWKLNNKVVRGKSARLTSSGRPPTRRR